MQEKTNRLAGKASSRTLHNFQGAGAPRIVHFQIQDQTLALKVDTFE
jgi:hypothetical protein